MTNSNSSNRPVARRTKVVRLIEEYDLDDIGDELEQRWTGRDVERDSLRTLAAVFNQRLLGVSMMEAGMDPLEGEVENVYRLLTDDEVSSGTRTETETRLRQEGVDMEVLRSDFVTYQAIRTYLKDVREATYSKDVSGSREKARSSFDRLIGRTTAVVERKLSQLKGNDLLSLGDFYVQTTVSVYCDDCETQYEVTSLLQRGGCACSTTGE
ncbi:rod-determining factor RdfA [Haladaptatus sp. CMAA 1911]|uniref:rod-determining factor RdfA n=1 Tax=unclassified Haladaptatus TaxID=2622732 RepID=UPI0037546ABA